MHGRNQKQQKPAYIGGTFHSKRYFQYQEKTRLV